MQRRLEYAGMRPISGTVDITNYVMLEYGQPLHAFDFDALVKRAGGAPPAIVVRTATEGETIVTLDKVERKLGADDLVIADALGPIAIAGVMGGLETEVGHATTSILLESACFDAVSVRKTARKFNLFSEASTRFSKGIHPELVGIGAMRAAESMQTHLGAEVLADAVDVYPAPLPVQVIELTAAEIVRSLGVEVPAARVERILKGLQFGVVATSKGWSVTVPTFRLDIQSGAADLIEELARIEGYDRLPGRLLSGVLPEQRDNRPLMLEEKARDLLADLGLQEVVTYSFSSAAKEAALGIAGKYVEIVNPISVDRNVMRRWLLPNVLEVVRENLKTAKEVRVFEVGTVFHPAREARLPAEFPRLAIVLTGRRSVEAWDDALGVEPAGVDFYDFKGIVEAFLGGLNVPAVTYRPATDFPFLHPGKSAEVLIDGRPVGMFGEMHPLKRRDLKFAETLTIGEFDLEAILEAVPVRFSYTPISSYPAALRDMAVVVPENATHEAVLTEIAAAGGEMLGGVRLFDVYRGESIPAGTKSLAFALTYRSKTGVLGEKEIESLHKKIEGRLKHVLGAAIRGQ